MQALLRPVFLSVALFALASCSVSSASTDGATDDGMPTGGTGGSGGAALELRFDKGEMLELDPGQRMRLTVTVTPNDVERNVRFALIDAGGSVADAWLDATEVTTLGGLAHVDLTASTVPTSFDVRALVGMVQKTLHVVVRSDDVELLVVEPSYAGERTVTEWVAQVFDAGTTCADIEGNPPVGSGAVRSVTVPYDDPIEIVNAPVGQPLAVTLRAGFFLGGCADADAIVEGQPSSVLVTVTNRPIQFDQSSVRVELGLVDQEEELQAGMQPVVDAAREAVLGMAASDPEALLNAMQLLARTNADCNETSFVSARGAGAWDSELAMALGVQATSLRDELGGWLTAGVPTLARDDAFVGALTAEPGVVGQANLVLSSVAGFRPADAGFARSVEATWMADADDSVVIGTTLEFNPSALVVLAARAPALMDEPEASSLAEALALRGGRCETVAATLTAHGDGPGLSCGDCDLACTRLLCEGAIARLVARASGALAGEEGATLRLAATGPAEVGEQAELQALGGSWVGELDAANLTTALGGELTAVGAYPAP